MQGRAGEFARTDIGNLRAFLDGFRYGKKVEPTYLQVMHPVLTLGVRLLGRLTRCSAVSMSDLSDDLSFSRRLMGIFWLRLDCIMDMIVAPCVRIIVRKKRLVYERTNGSRLSKTKE